jgi:hypothetical protein
MNKLKHQSTVNNQNTEDDLKLLLRILYMTTNISTLIHLCDQATYVWLTLLKVRIHSGTNCCTIRRVTLLPGRSVFNPHIPHGFSFLRTREYRSPGLEISEHWVCTIRGVGRRVVARQGSSIFLYEGDSLWRCFDLGYSCRTVQEVES